jgi:L-lactate dehydrogenase complex protein LldG
VAGAGKLQRVVAPPVTDARSEILGRIAQATREPAPIPRVYRREGSLSADARTQLFHDRVADYRAEVRRVDDIETAVAEICTQRAARRLAIPPGLTWRPAGVELVEDHGLSAEELDNVDGALTGCSAAIAESGTIVLTAGVEEGRRALTLVPDLHICVVRESQICELLPEALERIDSRRPITFVSGPSATSDIELSRVEGVHGPRTLIVLIAKEDS